MGRHDALSRVSFETSLIGVWLVQGAVDEGQATRVLEPAVCRPTGRTTESFVTARLFADRSRAEGRWDEVEEKWFLREAALQIGWLRFRWFVVVDFEGRLPTIGGRHSSILRRSSFPQIPRAILAFRLSLSSESQRWIQ